MKADVRWKNLTFHFCSSNIVTEMSSLRASVRLNSTLNSTLNSLIQLTTTLTTVCRPTTQPLWSAGLPIRFYLLYNWHQETPTSIFVNHQLILWAGNSKRARKKIRAKKSQFSSPEFSSRPFRLFPANYHLENHRGVGPGYKVDGHNIHYQNNQSFVLSFWRQNTILLSICNWLLHRLPHFKCTF